MKFLSVPHLRSDISATNGRRINSRQDLKRGSYALHACFGIKSIQTINRSPCERFRFFFFFASTEDFEGIQEVQPDLH